MASEALIPYRNSPLTKLLRSSFGKNSRTVIILCINPCFSQIDQTLCTLRFGQNAKKNESRLTANIHIQAARTDIKPVKRGVKTELKVILAVARVECYA